MSNLIQEGDQLFSDGNTYDALQKYLHSLFANGPAAELFKKIGHCNKMLGNNENAIEYYEKSLDLDGQNIEVLYNCGESYQLTNQLEEAIDLYDIVIELASDSGGNILDLANQKRNEARSVLLNRQGGAFMKEQNYSRAMDCFLQAIELNPKDRRNYLNIGVIYLNQGDTDQAIEWMNKAIAPDPAYLRSYYNLGTIYLKTGRYKHAINVFNKAIEIAPDDPECTDIRNNLSAANSANDQAENELKQILEGKTQNIALDALPGLIMSCSTHVIDFVDVAIQSDGTNQLMTYSKDEKFKIQSIHGEIKIELIK